MGPGRRGPSALPARHRPAIKALCCTNTKAEKHFTSGAFGGRRPLRSSRARRAPYRNRTLEVRGGEKNKTKNGIKKNREAPQPDGKRGGGQRAAALSSGAVGVAVPPGPASLHGGRRAVPAGPRPPPERGKQSRPDGPAGPAQREQRRACDHLLVRLL